MAPIVHLSFAKTLADRSAPTRTRCSETSASPSDHRSARQALLGPRSSMQVGMETSSHHRHARNRSPLAPDWLSNVLAADLPRQAGENPTRGAPRIQEELRMLGFELSERTISRWMNQSPRDPDRAKRWLAFLRNHREAIAAMDFFTVPTITFGASSSSRARAKGPWPFNRRLGIRKVRSQQSAP